MANTNKTKAEILQELETIKGLLLEEDDIPILQTIDHSHHEEPSPPDSAVIYSNPAVLPGQTSLFEDEPAAHTSLPESAVVTSQQTEQTAGKTTGFASHLNRPKSTYGNQAETNAPRSLGKASGENPFLPQHIRERLHGNNPPPLFEYETAKKILNATKNIANKINKPRQTLVDEVVNGLMPQIEAELRHRLFAMSIEDLEKLLTEDDA